MDARRLTTEGASRPLSVPAGSCLDDAGVRFLPSFASGGLDWRSPSRPQERSSVDLAGPSAQPFFADRSERCTWEDRPIGTLTSLMPICSSLFFVVLGRDDWPTPSALDRVLSKPAPRPCARDAFQPIASARTWSAVVAEGVGRATSDTGLRLDQQLVHTSLVAFLTTVDVEAAGITLGCGAPADDYLAVQPEGCQNLCSARNPSLDTLQAPAFADACTRGCRRNRTDITTPTIRRLWSSGRLRDRSVEPEDRRSETAARPEARGKQVRHSPIRHKRAVPPTGSPGKRSVGKRYTHAGPRLSGNVAAKER
jgi:hypothetical protein